MGSGQSKGLKGGYRILKICENSPASECDLEIFFDYIVQIEGIKIVDGSRKIYESFLNKVKESENKCVVLLVYNCRFNKTKEIKIIPQKWKGNGLLGININYEPFNALNEGTRIIDILKNSPAENSDLVEQNDFLIGCEDSILRSREDVLTYVNSKYIEHIKSPNNDVLYINFFVYNIDTKTIRKVKLQPNKSWGGDGLLGCNIANGILHKIPVCSSENNSMGHETIPVTATNVMDTVNTNNVMDTTTITTTADTTNVISVMESKGSTHELGEHMTKAKIIQVENTSQNTKEKTTETTSMTSMKGMKSMKGITRMTSLMSSTKETVEYIDSENKSQSNDLNEGIESSNENKVLEILKETECSETPNENIFLNTSVLPNEKKKEFIEKGEEIVGVMKITNDQDLYSSNKEVEKGSKNEKENEKENESDSNRNGNRNYNNNNNNNNNSNNSSNSECELECELERIREREVREGDRVKMEKYHNPTEVNSDHNIMLTSEKQVENEKAKIEEKLQVAKHVKENVEGKEKSEEEKGEKETDVKGNMEDEDTENEENQNGDIDFVEQMNTYTKEVDEICARMNKNNEILSNLGLDTKMKNFSYHNQSSEINFIPNRINSEESLTYNSLKKEEDRQDSNDEQKIDNDKIKDNGEDKVGKGGKDINIGSGWKNEEEKADNINQRMNKKYENGDESVENVHLEKYVEKKKCIQNNNENTIEENREDVYVNVNVNRNRNESEKNRKDKIGEIDKVNVILNDNDGNNDNNNDDGTYRKHIFTTNDDINLMATDLPKAGIIYPTVDL